MNDRTETVVSAERNQDRSETSLGELAPLFLKLGTIAFGGPAAHIAMMEDEVVKRRRWLATNNSSICSVRESNPRSQSTEMAIHIGLVRAGWKGLVVAGSCLSYRHVDRLVSGGAIRQVRLVG